MNRSITVIKFGGNALNKRSIAFFCQSILKLTKKGITPIIVHGGGPQINDYLHKLNIKEQFVNGLRYTDDKTLAVAEMVLSGKVNKYITQNLNQNSLPAVGINGKDANTLIAKKYTTDAQGKTIDIGWVGEITTVNLSLINHLIEGDFIPVIAPIAIGGKGETYNVNADICAAKIAKAMTADKLIFMTNIDGLLDKKQQLITQLSISQAKQLIANSTISGGMIPKIQSAIDALKTISSVHIINAKNPEALTLLLNKKTTIGTTLVN